MNIRRVPPIDELERGEERLVLVDERAVHVVGLAPAILDLTIGWCALERLTHELEKLYGTPPDGNALATVRAAVTQLAAEGLVEIEAGRT